MQLTTETFGHVMVVHTPEDLTEDTASLFLDAMDGVIAQGQVKIVLEMDHSEAYDSAGLTALLDLYDRLLEKGGNVKISGLGEPGRKIFEVTRLDRLFDIFDSVIDAVASFR